VSNSEQTLPAIKILDKLSTVMTGMQLKEGYGTREAAQIINMVRSSYPNAGQVPGAPEALLKFMDGMNQWTIDTQKGLAEWKSTHGNSAEGFPEAWNQSHPASSVPPLTLLQDISQGKPLGTTQPKEPTYAIAPAARGNSTVQAILKSGSPEDKAKLAAKGYLVTQ
jgi:hypothetical protein